MAQNSPAASAPPPAHDDSNGLVAPTNLPGPAGGSRKKQKRRAKEAAKKAASQESQHHAAPTSPQAPHNHTRRGSQNDVNSDRSPDCYSEAEGDEDDEDDYAGAAPVHHPARVPHQHHVHDPAASPSPAAVKRKGKKKRRSISAQQNHHQPQPPASHFDSHNSSYPTPPPPPPPPPPPMSSATFRSVQRGAKQDRIWNTSTQEERERIKEFWLSLSEEERKSLLKIEKEAVLRKMKEQQKHSCSCTVCGRKRTAIEEELEVLYDAYYEELEQYAHTKGDPSDGMLPPPRPLHRHLPSPSPLASRLPGLPLPLNPANTRHRTSRVHEMMDDEDREEVSEGDEEEYSEDEDEDDDDDDDDADEDDDDDELYSDEEDEPDDHLPGGMTADFFQFGNSLTVKGGILTVADDLLKNDGKKFIEMMEQLAERRMQREQEAEYQATQPAHSYPPNPHDHQVEEDDYEEDEEDYDSQEEYEDEEEDEDEMGGMSEEQRMEEGRRMFQIFAARMFEQRVLTAYREKVAAERQKRLLEELEDETRLDAEREAKKARDAEKRKKKKEAQKQAKAEEKARKEAEKAAEEAALREIEEKKRLEQQRKKEEQRKKKEAERKAQEEERQRKETERLKRQQEERERQQESERKLREQKALEKKQRDEARKKEREERETREREAKEKRAQDEREKREREAKAKVEREAHERERKLMQQHSNMHPPQIAKRPSQLGMVAVPPGLHPKQSSSNVNSPHLAVATPVLPKAPTPGRQNSQYGSHTSPPRSSPFSASKSTSPGNSSASQSSVLPKSILQKPYGQTPMMQHPQPTSPPNHLPPPPGMPHSSLGNPFGSLPPMGGFPGFHQPHGSFMNHRQSVQGYPQHPQIGSPFQPFHGSNGMTGPPPPSVNGLGMGPSSRGFHLDNPAAFGQSQMPLTGAAPGFGLPRQSMPSHSRTQSSDKVGIDPLSTQPIARPTPIQRPSSVKPHEGHMSNGEDDPSKHLGSSALLDDADEPLPIASERRQSAFAGPRASGPIGMGSPFAGPARLDSFATPGSSWTSPSMFGPPGLTSSSSWGAALGSPSWTHNGFGSLSHRPSGPNRPLTIRLSLCQACKQLAVREPTKDDFHPVDSILRQIEASRPLVDSPITLKEIEDICETEGDAQNGGGLLHVRHDGNNSSSFSVKFEPDAGTPSTGRAPAVLGEIGSPIPGHSVPAFGTSAPNRMSGFGSLSAAVAGSPGVSNGFS
ncbi:hypothetical protein AAFC00_001457 [Neodothiora populina]|uniref:Stress response protein NST1 n=1 Tax=Neodothiora populina TaxID=2781224 RepID=A0ABR3PNZ4_9PEZI